MEDKYTEIRDIILRNIPDVGNFPTTIPGVRIVKRIQCTEFLICSYLQSYFGNQFTKTAGK